MPTAKYRPRRAKQRPIAASIAICALFGLLAGLLTLFVQAAFAKVPPDPADPPKIAAHRGNTTVRDENTISAFKYALPYADILETDVRLTSDKKMVLMHDATLDRTTNCTGAVSRRTLAYTKSCTTGRGQHPPSLRQFLVWVAAQPEEVELSLDLKGPWSQTNVYRFVREVASYEAIQYATANSESESTLEKVKVANDALPDEDAGRNLATALGEGGPPFAEPFHVCAQYDAYYTQLRWVEKDVVHILQQVCNPPTAVAVFVLKSTKVSDYEAALATGAKVIAVEDAKHARAWLDSR